jgi:hypothetical protein
MMGWMMARCYKQGHHGFVGRPLLTFWERSSRAAIMVMSVMWRLKQNLIPKSSNHQTHTVWTCVTAKKDAGVGPHPVLDVPCGWDVGTILCLDLHPQTCKWRDSYRHVVGQSESQKLDDLHWKSLKSVDHISRFSSGYTHCKPLPFLHSFFAPWDSTMKTSASRCSATWR